MRSTIGGEFDFDLELSGDKYFKGAAGREAVERAIASYQGRLSAPGDKGPLLSDISKTLMEQQEKVSVVGDSAKYPELPSDLRAKELARTRGFVKTLEGLRDKAMAAIQAPASQPTAGAGAAKATVPAKAGAQSKESAKTPAGPETASQAVAREWQELAAAEERFKAIKDSARSSRYKAQHSRWVQVGGAYAFHYSAYEKFGTDGYVFDGEFMAEYKAADGSYQKGQELDRVFSRVKSETMIAASQAPQNWVGKIKTQLGGMLSNTAGSYESADTYYRGAERIYQRVKGLILAKDPGNVNAFFLGYDKPLPDGANIP
jgi:hypothetical protein